MTAGHSTRMAAAVTHDHIIRAIAMSGVAVLLWQMEVNKDRNLGFDEIASAKRRLTKFPSPSSVNSA